MSNATGPGSRQRLLDAAADLFYRQGIGAVGVDLVSKAAGVSKRTLYQQFGSKDQLVAQSLDAHGMDILGLYLPAGGSDVPPREQILAIFDGLGRWTASDAFRGCPFVNTATELADPGHPARRGSAAPGRPADRGLRRGHRAGGDGYRPPRRRRADRGRRPA
jgi:AcrR family transcriptional regulator